MIHAQNAKWFQMLAPLSQTGAATTLVIDTLGYDYLEIAVLHGLIGAGTYTALKIQESDTKATASTLTGGVDITGLVFGTSTTIAGAVSTFPGDVNDGTVDLFEIDLRARKRYLLLVATPGAVSLVAAIGRLSRSEQAPTTAALKGVREALRA